MFIKNLGNFRNRIYRNAEGGASGGADGGTAAAAGADAGGAPAAGKATDDGTGGKASMMSESKPAAGSEAGQPLDLKALLGDDLAKDPNVSKFLETKNPVQELAKSLVEAQKQIGKPKVGIPGEKATAEEKASFYKELGVPENEDGYEFTKPEGLPDEAWSPEHAKKWAGLMKQHNVPKEAAAGLREAMMTEMSEATVAANKTLNDHLDKTFGDKKTVVSKEVGEVLAKAIPDAAMRAQIQTALDDKLTPAVAVALGSMLQYMKKTYGQSDINTGDEGNGFEGKTIAELRTDAQKLMASPEYRDPMNSKYKETKKTVDGMYAQIGALTNAAKKK